MKPIASIFALLVASLSLGLSAAEPSASLAHPDLAAKYRAAKPLRRLSDTLAGISAVRVLDIAVEPGLRSIAPPQAIFRVFSEALGEAGVRIVDEAPVSLHVSLEADRLLNVHYFLCTVEISKSVPVDVGGEFKLVPVNLWEKRAMQSATEGLLPRAVAEMLTIKAQQLAAAFAEAKRDPTKTSEGVGR